MILKVLPDTHPSLRKVCKKVDDPSKHTKLALSMIDTVKAHKAYGLAANQVGRDLRIIVVHTNLFLHVMYNPEIIEKSEEIFNFNEGCLSMKGKFIDTNARSKEIVVQWENNRGEWQKQVFFDLHAVIIQHEIDHLDGKLMSDYVHK
jgi:peptide deformylase